MGTGEMGTDGRLVRWRTTCGIEGFLRTGTHKTRAADRANGERSTSTAFEPATKIWSPSGTPR